MLLSGSRPASLLIRARTSSAPCGSANSLTWSWPSLPQHSRRKAWQGWIMGSFQSRQRDRCCTMAVAHPPLCYMDKALSDLLMMSHRSLSNWMKSSSRVSCSPRWSSNNQAMMATQGEWFIDCPFFREWSRWTWCLSDCDLRTGWEFEADSRGFKHPHDLTWCLSREPSASQHIFVNAKDQIQMPADVLPIEEYIGEFEARVSFLGCSFARFGHRPG